MLTSYPVSSAKQRTRGHLIVSIKQKIKAATVWAIVTLYLKYKSGISSQWTFFFRFLRFLVCPAESAKQSTAAIT